MELIEDVVVRLNTIKIKSNPDLDQISEQLSTPAEIDGVAYEFIDANLDVKVDTYYSDIVVFEASNIQTIAIAGKSIDISRNAHIPVVVPTIFCGRPEIYIKKKVPYVTFVYTCIVLKIDSIYKIKYPMKNRHNMLFIKDKVIF
jgi:hypothetical protein